MVTGESDRRSTQRAMAAWPSLQCERTDDDYRQTINGCTRRSGPATLGQPPAVHPHTRRRTARVCSRPQRAFATCLLNQDAAHGLGGSGEEVAAAVPALGLLRIDQPEVGLVDQGRGLERLPGLLLGQPLRRQLA